MVSDRKHAERQAGPHLGLR